MTRQNLTVTLHATTRFVRCAQRKLWYQVIADLKDLDRGGEPRPYILDFDVPFEDIDGLEMPNVGESIFFLKWIYPHLDRFNGAGQ